MATHPHPRLWLLPCDRLRIRCTLIVRAQRWDYSSQPATREPLAGTSSRAGSELPVPGRRQVQEEFSMSDSQRAVTRAPMDSMRKTALVAGIFYLITFISIPTLALYGPVKTDPNFILNVGGDTAILVAACSRRSSP